MTERYDNNRPEIMVSVIMPAYNAEQFVEQAIRSVMEQTIPNWELLVLDDCSRDKTCEIVERLAAEDGRIVLLRNENNQGVAKTRNRGLDQCRGSYVAFLDSDDVWHPEKLETQIELLKQANADLSYCAYEVINQDGHRVKKDYLVPQNIGFEDLLKENVIGCSTVVLTEKIAKTYRFKEAFYHEDYVLWLQILKDGYRTVGSREILAQWRYIENSRSFDKRRSARNRWKIYREYLGLSPVKSAYFFINYVLAGLKKYLRKHH